MRQIDGTRESRRAALLRPLLCVLTMTAAAVIGGCTPWATYPPVEGSTGLHEPWLSPIPDVIAQAVRFAHFEDGRSDEIVVNMPEGTPLRVYTRVLDLLGEGRPMQDPSESAYHVRQVRVRTVQSEVDLIHRDAHGKPQEMTVTVDRNLLSGFFVSDVRYWRYSVEEPRPHLTATAAALIEARRAAALAPDSEMTGAGNTGDEGDVGSWTDAAPREWPYE